jgi:phage tail tape-measure protein
MGWWQTVKDKEAADDAGTDHSFSDIIDNAYNFARAGFMVDIDARNPGVATSTIQRYIGQGRIPSFSNITPVIVGWPWVVAAQGQGASAQGMAIGPGGGARKKTSRKHKFRKNKTKRLALRKTKNKKRRRTSKK